MNKLLVSAALIAMMSATSPVLADNDKGQPNVATPQMMAYVAKINASKVENNKKLRALMANPVAFKAAIYGLNTRNKMVNVAMNK